MGNLTIFHEPKLLHTEISTFNQIWSDSMTIKQPNAHFIHNIVTDPKGKKKNKICVWLFGQFHSCLC